MDIKSIQLCYSQLEKFNANSDGRERCGLVLADRADNLCVVEVPNHDTGIDRYVLKKSDTLRVMELLPFMELVGILHTHVIPPIYPSRDDIEAIRMYPDLFGAVYCLQTRTVVYYDHAGGRRIQVFKRERNNDGDMAKPEGWRSRRVGVPELVGDDGGR